jgi:transposase InsO family protein
MSDVEKWCPEPLWLLASTRLMSPHKPVSGTAAPVDGRDRDLLRQQPRGVVLVDVQREHYYRHIYSTKTELVAAIDKWIMFYNSVRRHSVLGMLSPDDYEKSLRAAA